MIILNAMIAGGIAVSSFIISLFFLRFWHSTKDRFFLFFSLSFFLEGINRILLGLAITANENVPEFYILRVIAYLLILYAIFDKNRQRK